MAKYFKVTIGTRLTSVFSIVYDTVTNVNTFNHTASIYDSLTNTYSEASDITYDQLTDNGGAIVRTDDDVYKLKIIDENDYCNDCTSVAFQSELISDFLPPSGSTYESNNGNFSGSFPIPPADCQFLDRRDTPTISIPQSSLGDVFESETGSPPLSNVEFEFSFGYTIEFSGSGAPEEGTLSTVLAFTTSSFSDFTRDPDFSTYITMSDTLVETGSNSITLQEEGTILFYPTDYGVTNNDWNYLYFTPLFKIANTSSIKYKFRDFTLSVNMTDANSYESFLVMTGSKQLDSSYNDGWNIYEPPLLSS